MTNGDITVTHDELLDKLNRVWDREPDETQWELIEKLRNALRAVVELHKPWNNGDKDICQECANLIDPWDENCYPCPTIQAIEKELA
jgi:hypothetical protein